MAPSQIRLSQKLHSELTEYSSLLRALRANSTLDLASQLARYSSPPTTPASSRPVSVPPDMRHISQRTTESPPLEDVSAVALGKRKRDTWTRWPLLLDDVFVPEWTFEDEVCAVAEQYLRIIDVAPLDPTGVQPTEDEDGDEERRHARSSTEKQWSDVEDEDLWEDEDDDNVLSDAQTFAVTLESSEFLSNILRVLAIHWPTIQSILGNRLNPIDWVAVLDIVCAAGLVDASSLKGIQATMETIYGPSRSPVVSRMDEAAASQRNLEKLKRKHPVDLFEAPKLSQRKRRKN